MTTHGLGPSTHGQWEIQKANSLERTVMKYGNLTLGQIEAGINKIGGEDAFLRLLRDELIVSEVPTDSAPAPALEPEPAIDPIIRVDHSVKPSYPDWVKEALHPDLEAQGPAEYDVAKIDQWLHDGQKDGKWISGNKIYAHLLGTPEKPGDLASHLGTRDLEEIQKKGIAFFRKFFKGKYVFAWKGVVRNHDGHLNVPCLCEDDGKVVQYWLFLGHGWHGRNPGPRHASSPKA